MPDLSNAYLVVVALPYGHHFLDEVVPGVTPNVGQVFPWRLRNALGRCAGLNKIDLPWSVVSRKQSQIDFDGESTWEIQDLLSRNGTFVNGQQLAPHEPWPICDGDHIHIAGLFGVELLFTFNPAGNIPDPARTLTYEEFLAEDEFR